MNAKQEWKRLMAAALVTVAAGFPATTASAGPGGKVTGTASAPARGDLQVQVVPVERVRPRPIAPELVRRPVGRRGLRVRVWTSPGEGSLVFPGDDMQVRFRVNRSAYVVVYDIDTRGRVRLLFPEFPGDDGYVRGKRILRIPGRRAGYRLMVTGPSGVERIVALASNRPLVRRWRGIARREGLLGAALAPRLRVRPRVIPVRRVRRTLAWDETWFEVDSRWWR